MAILFKVQEKDFQIKSFMMIIVAYKEPFSYLLVFTFTSTVEVDICILVLYNLEISLKK